MGLNTIYIDKIITKADNCGQHTISNSSSRVTSHTAACGV